MLVDARELINTDIIRRLIRGTGGYVYTSNISSYISSYVTSIVGGAALQGSGAYTQNTGTIQFANSNGLSFGLTNGIMTGSYSQSTHAHPFAGTLTAGTNVTMTLNSAGLTLSVNPTGSMTGDFNIDGGDAYAVYGGIPIIDVGEA